MVKLNEDKTTKVIRPRCEFVEDFDKNYSNRDGLKYQ